jgi:hypothetical protein
VRVHREAPVGRVPAFTKERIVSGVSFWLAMLCIKVELTEFLRLSGASATHIIGFSEDA